jgi:periplasmic divalent cation tolerance protein
MTDRTLVVFITTPGPLASEKLALGLLRGKWAACVNRVPGLTSRYWWKGKIETAREELLVVKTLISKWPGLEKWVRSHHPYSVCEILALPASAVSRPYLKWIRESLTPDRRLKRK